MHSPIRDRMPSATEGAQQTLLSGTLFSIKKEFSALLARGAPTFGSREPGRSIQVNEREFNRDDRSKIPSPVHRDVGVLLC
jgi:hypothetical protein